MFSGIIESVGIVDSIVKNGTNIDLKIRSKISKESYIDQSISHNGVCLTVVKMDEDTHTVTAINETLEKTNLGNLKVGNIVNLERAIRADSRMDGHFVQGHVDGIIHCVERREANGSWYFGFEVEDKDKKLLVPQGSICINGVSLTVAKLEGSYFEVAIIPYTFENTGFKTLETGDIANVEFDILGKYITRYLEQLQLPK